MKILSHLLLLMLSFQCFGQSKTESLNLLIVTGGHDFEHAPFFEMFDNMEGIFYKEAVQPMGNQMIEKGEIDDVDVLVFYDMYDQITEAQKKAYIHLLDQGTAMVFLHHSLVSYQDWPEFTNIIGGKFIHEGEKASTYEHDVPIDITIADKKHPITARVDDWTIIDETYGKCIVIDGLHPLLATNNPNSLPYLGWTNDYGNSTVVYLQSGHGPSGYEDENYLKLLEQAIRWSAEHHK